MGKCRSCNLCNEYIPGAEVVELLEHGLRVTPEIDVTLGAAGVQDDRPMEHETPDLRSADVER